VYGTTQNVQNLSQPSCTDTNAETPSAPRAGNPSNFASGVIGLRPDDQIDRRRAPRDLFALRLRHTPRHRNGHVAAFRAPAILLLLQPAERGEYFLRRLFADVAGVEDDEIGALRRIGLHEPERAQHVAHTFGIVDVHLAAVRLDIEALGATALRLRNGVRVSVCHGKSCRNNIMLAQRRRKVDAIWKDDRSAAAPLCVVLVDRHAVELKPVIDELVAEPRGDLLL
jgi:hypothetical protein